jgi:hypothetical protein
MIRTILSLIVTFFLSHTAFAETDIAEYIIAGDYRALERALQEGVNPNTFSKSKIYFNAAPLISFAAFYGDTRTLSIMLEHLANPNIPGDSGETPLMYAVVACKYIAGPCEDKIMLLLLHDADPFIKNKYGDSAESLANGEYKEHVSDKIRMHFENAKIK